MSKARQTILRSVQEQRRDRERGGLGAPPGLPSVHRPGVAFGSRAAFGSLQRWKMFTGGQALTSAEVDDLYALMMQALSSPGPSTDAMSAPADDGSSGGNEAQNLQGLAPHLDFSKRAQTVAQQLRRATSVANVRTTMLRPR